MGRSLPTIQLNRRQFVLGAAAVGIAACGPVDGGADGGPADTGFMPQPDAGAPDAGMAPTCPGGSAAAIDTGKRPSDIAEGSPFYSGSALSHLVRDQGGLYAVSAVCTHASCLVTTSQGKFSCPCHGSLFGADGTALSGPASLPLPHYAVCLTAGGTLAIDKSQVVDKGTRLAG